MSVKAVHLGMLQLKLEILYVSLQIESEFPEILPIRESLIKYVFEPNAAKVSVGF